MTSAVQPMSRRPAGRGLLLLVLAVLAGVLAMHALAPGPVPQMAHAGATGEHGMAMAGEVVHQASGDCSHTVGGSGHVGHADADCAATGVGTPYTPPALAVALDAVPAAAVPSVGSVASADSERAPPDLAELQLLRI